MARRKKQPPRGSRVLRWAAVLAFVVVALLYYRPARTYLHTRHTVDARTAEVAKLRQEHKRLQRLVAASASDAELAREARRLGLVKPGERLFIVKGINRWLKRHSSSSLGGGG